MMNLQMLQKIAPGAGSMSALVNVPRRTPGQHKFITELQKEKNLNQNQNKNLNNKQMNKQKTIKTTNNESLK